MSKAEIVEMGNSRKKEETDKCYHKRTNERIDSRILDVGLHWLVLMSSGLLKEYILCSSFSINNFIYNFCSYLNNFIYS